MRDKLYAAGVAPEQIIVDPGLGFSKNDDQNWELLRATWTCCRLGHKVLVGALPQTFPRQPADHGRQGRRAQGTRRRHRRRSTAMAAANGAWAVRVHDVGAEP